MDGRFVLVVNPRAGAGTAGRRLPVLRAALDRRGAEHELRLTESPRDATRIVREVLKQGSHTGVAVVGGDGTLNEAVNGFFEPDGTAIPTDAWLAPLPCGTGGDFRRTLRIKKGDFDGMVARMLATEPRPIDAGWLTFVDERGGPGGCAFVNIASCGLGGRVVRKVDAGPKWMGGTPAFLLGTVRGMIGYANQGVRVRVDDGAPRELRVLNLAVANGRYFGGGMQIAPRAEIDDGLFDVVALEMSSLAILARAARVYAGTHLDLPGVWHTRGKRVVVEAVDPAERVLLEADGEAPGALPATFELRPGALRLKV